MTYLIEIPAIAVCLQVNLRAFSLHTILVSFMPKCSGLNYLSNLTDLLQLHNSTNNIRV